MRRYGASHMVPWPEVRLFALVRSNEFELASTSSIVRWNRPTDAQFIEPTIPFADYRQQMDAMLLLIAARTGLVLFNLRDSAA